MRGDAGPLLLPGRPKGSGEAWVEDLMQNGRRLAASLVVALVAAWPAAALAAECPAERAVYGLDTEDGPLELGFVPARSMATIASDLYMYLTTTQRT